MKADRVLLVLMWVMIGAALELVAGLLVIFGLGIAIVVWVLAIRHFNAKAEREAETI